MGDPVNIRENPKTHHCSSVFLIKVKFIFQKWGPSSKAVLLYAISRVCQRKITRRSQPFNQKMLFSHYEPKKENKKMLLIISIYNSFHFKQLCTLLEKTILTIALSLPLIKSDIWIITFNFPKCFPLFIMCLKPQKRMGTWHRRLEGRDNGVWCDVSKYTGLANGRDKVEEFRTSGSIFALRLFINPDTFILFPTKGNHSEPMR